MKTARVQRSTEEIAVRRAVGLSQAVAGANLSAVTIAFADIADAFPDDPLSAVSWVLTIYTIVFGATLVPFGRLADRIGRDRVFNWGLAVFALGCLLAAVAPVLWALIAGRVVQGLGGALLMPAALGLLLDATPLERRTEANAFAAATASAGMTIGPVVGGISAELLGWRTVFAGPALFALLAWWLGRGKLPKGVPVKDTALPDLMGAALIIVAISVLSLGVVQGDDWGWGSTRTDACFLASVLALVAFVARSARHPAPVLPLGLLRHRATGMATLATLGFGLGSGALFFVSVQFLTVVWGYSVLAAGMAQVITASASVVGSVLAGRLGPRYGERRVGVAATCVTLSAVVALALLLGEESGFWTVWAPFAGLAFFGSTMVFSLVLALTVQSAPTEHLSVATASSRTAFQTGTSIGVAIMVAVIGTLAGVDSLDGFIQAHWVIVGMLALTAVAFALTGPVRRRSPARAAVELEPAAR